MSKPNSDQKRFKSKVAVQTNRCWIWMGGKLSDGRGYFHMGRSKERAHRAAHMLFIGPIPEGKVVTTTCGNQECVSPLHLVACTLSEAKQMLKAQGRQGGIVSRFSKGDIERANALRQSGASHKDIAAALVCSTASVGKLLRGDIVRLRKV